MWAAGCSLFFYVFLQRTAPSVMTTELMRAFGVTASALGHLAAAYFWAYALVQLPVGAAVDRWGPRRLLCWSAALGGAGGLLFAQADTLTAASVGRLLVGAGGGVVFVATLKIVADWFPPQRLAMLTGGLMMVGMVGGVFGQAPLALAMEAWGWRAIMAGGAGLVIALALLAWFVVSDRPATAAAGAAPPSILAGLGRCLRRGQTWLVAVFMLFLLPPLFAFGSLWGVPYLVDIHGFTRPDAAFAVSLMLVGWGGLAPVFGWLSDRWRRRKPFLIAAAAAGCATMAALIYGPAWSAGAIYGLLALNGVFAGAMVVAYATSRELNDPEDAGAALAIVNMGVIASGAIAQTVVGWLLDLNWRGGLADGIRVYDRVAYDGAFWVFPGSCAVAVALACLIRETRAGTRPTDG